MAADRRVMLKDRFGFGEWRGRNMLGEGFLLWKFALFGNELPSMRVHKIESSAIPKGPSQTQSIWQRPEGTADALVRLDVYELPSRLAAHEYLIDVLAQFQSPLVARLEPPPCGDVAFGSGNSWMLLFSRANLVVHVRSVGRELISVVELARAFDTRLVSKPVPGGAGSKLGRLSATALDTAGVRLEVAATESTQGPVWFKFFSPGGECDIENGQPVFRPTQPDRWKITAIAVDATGNMTHEVLTV